MPDVRVSDPNGTSIYEKLTFSKIETVDKPEEKAPPGIAKDQSTIEKKETNNTVKNVDFVEKKDEPTKVVALPLSDPKDPNKLLKFVVDEQGKPVIDEAGNPKFDEKNGQVVFVKADENGQPVLDENKKFIFVPADQVKVPAETVDLSEKKPEAPADSTSTSTAKTPTPGDAGKISMLTDKKTGEPMMLIVDDNGIPILDAKGDLQHDSVKGKHVYAKVDDNNQLILNEKGEPIFVKADGQDVPPLPPDVKNAMNALTAHASQRIGVLSTKSMVTGGVRAISKKLVTGAHVGIPFTEKALGFGVKHAVVKAVSAEVKAIPLATHGGTTIVKSLETAEKTAAAGAVKTLTESGKLGKGVEVLTMKEAANAFKKPATNIVGKIINKVNPVPVVKASVKSAKDMTKVLSEASEKGVVEGTKSVVKNTFVGAGETVLKQGVEKGTEAGIKTVLKKEGSKIAETVTTKAVEEALVKTAEKAAVETAVKGTAKVGATAARFVPIAGAVASAGITAWDAHDAWKKTTDPKVGKLSTALAWTTVGLDAVSTVATATGVGTPIGWVATGLSIGTSIASDYFK
jgi:hypothetical protein